MNDGYDNARTDKEMLARYGAGPLRPGEALEPHLAKYLAMSEAAPSLGIDLAEAPLCRWCWRPVFLQLLKNDAVWDLQYQEYENTPYCDARSDGANLSTLPHEPCGAVFANISTLIANAARVALEPEASEEANQHRLVVMAELIALTAGVPEENVPWVLTAIIRKAGEGSEKFRQAAWQAGATDWPVKP
jgi:hypothetical protein